MTEQQAIRMMETLARLYADQYGIENPEIKVSVTLKGGRKCHL